MLSGALASAPTCALAAGDFDSIDQADVLQKQAMQAAREGDWKLARKLAEEVLILDVSFATAPSRLVLARALQVDENFDGALYELRQLERLEGVDSRVLEDVASLRTEIEVAKARAEWEASRPARDEPSDRGVGIGLLAGGAAPVVLGGFFLGNDINHAAQGEESGTWAVIGAPVLATGVILEVVGAALLSRSAKARTSGLRIDGVTIAADGDSVLIGIGGRF